MQACVQVLMHVRGEIIPAVMGPLPPGALGQRIEQLAASVGFPCHRIFVLEGTMLVRNS